MHRGRSGREGVTVSDRVLPMHLFFIHESLCSTAMDERAPNGGSLGPRQQPNNFRRAEVLGGGGVIRGSMIPNVIGVFATRGVNHNRLQM